LTEIDEHITAKKRDISGLETSLDEMRTQEHELQDTLAEATKMLDKLLNKRSLLLDTIQTRQRMIRDLGALPRKELESLKDLAVKQLLNRLKDVNEQLKKYSSVNRKALDQFVSFNEQKETLIQRRTEMERDSTSIIQLIESLDAQKDEGILRTFRGVSHHFTEVFAELVPGGVGNLPWYPRKIKFQSRARKKGEVWLLKMMMNWRINMKEIKVTISWKVWKNQVPMRSILSKESR
jgi:structural maintenance of chromosome 3 (chondroitin sulfate proteoglycan 6)